MSCASVANCFPYGFSNLNDHFECVRKLSTTIGANSYAYLHNMVKAGKAESVGQAVDMAVEMARQLDSRATLERRTAAYFKGQTAKAAAEEADLEEALSAASQEMDFDQP